MGYETTQFTPPPPLRPAPRRRTEVHTCPKCLGEKWVEDLLATTGTSGRKLCPTCRGLGYIVIRPTEGMPS